MARAYIDQLARDEALDAETIIELSQSLDRADEQLGAGARDRELAGNLEQLAEALGEEDGGDASARRRTELAATLGSIAARLR